MTLLLNLRKLLAMSSGKWNARVGDIERHDQGERIQHIDRAYRLVAGMRQLLDTNCNLSLDFLPGERLEISLVVHLPVDEEGEFGERHPVVNKIVIYEVVVVEVRHLHDTALGHAHRNVILVPALSLQLLHVVGVILENGLEREAVTDLCDLIGLQVVLEDLDLQRIRVALFNLACVVTADIRHKNTLLILRSTRVDIKLIDVEDLYG